MTAEQAREVRARGHKDAREFAYLIGLKKDYQNDPKAKKDVIDRNGDAHSVKSGMKKWQIFLYGKRRFEDDLAFQAMNGIGQLCIECIEAFPPSRDDYLKDKIKYKTKLTKPMIALCAKLKFPGRLSTFLGKSLLNGGEVNYLTIKSEGAFHVFWGEEVIRILSNNIGVENSQARQVNQVAAQKVVFKVGTTLGEIEMRNDSPIHYREIKFWMHKAKTFTLLASKIEPMEEWKTGLCIYGKAIKRFARNHKSALVSQ